MHISLRFHSYFKDLTGCAEASETLPEGSTLETLYQRVAARFPRIAAMQKSTLLAVGVDYQPRQYVLNDGDEVSFFPPVQGG